MSTAARNVIAAAAVYPATPCVWCGQGFDARSAYAEAPGTPAGYIHTGDGRIGAPDCAGELAAALGLRAEADFDPFTSPVPFDVAA